MTDRLQVEQLLRELHAARLDGNLERLCKLFSPDARLRIAGSSDGKPIAIAASGIGQIHSWLSMLLKTFRLSRYRLLSLTVDGSRAAGVMLPTELVDLVEVREERIAAYTEFFVPC